MNLKEKIKNFNKRWDVDDDETYEESFKKFKTRIINILKNIDSIVSQESVSLFCQVYGISENWNCDMLGHIYSENIINRIYGEDNEVEFYKLLEVIFSLDIRGLCEYDKNKIYNKVKEAIDFSNVNLVTTIDKKSEIIFYPKGEELLDEELVNKLLKFLDEESNKHFIDALKFYQLKKMVKSAESLRRVLEQFLKYKLNNNKGLKENINELQKKLKIDKRDVNIRKVIFQIFNFLDSYFNENSKHNDGNINESECEYLIYQVGVIIRYMEKNL